MITREQFIAATGYEPVDDDLERCNCPLAGGPAHMVCGWCDIHNKPVFLCSAICWRVVPVSSVET